MPVIVQPVDRTGYMPHGMMQGTEDSGIPVVVQAANDPYARIAYRNVGGGQVEPLIGYPSRYPHVLDGTRRRYGEPLYVPDYLSMLGWLSQRGRTPANTAAPRRAAGSAPAKQQPATNNPPVRLPFAESHGPEMAPSHEPMVIPQQPAAPNMPLIRAPMVGATTTVSHHNPNMTLTAPAPQMQQPQQNGQWLITPTISPAMAPSHIDVTKLAQPLPQTPAPLPAASHEPSMQTGPLDYGNPVSNAAAEAGYNAGARARALLDNPTALFDNPVSNAAAEAGYNTGARARALLDAASEGARTLIDNPMSNAAAQAGYNAGTTARRLVDGMNAGAQTMLDAAADPFYGSALARYIDMGFRAPTITVQQPAPYVDRYSLR